MKLFILMMIFSLNTLAADDLVPATSEDIQAFDSEIMKAGIEQEQRGLNKKSFSEDIKSEASKLGDRAKTGKEMQQWGDGPRHREGQRRNVGPDSPAGAPGNYLNTGGGNDPRMNAPRGVQPPTHP